jgi:hypothetical protein
VLYTKSDISSKYSYLTPYLYRHPNSDPSKLDVYKERMLATIQKTFNVNIDDTVKE